MGNELESAKAWEIMDKVAQLHLKGDQAPVIAKKLRMRTADVERTLGEWRYFIRNNMSIQEKATETLYRTDAHLNEIIKELWSVVEAATDSGQLSIKNVSLKNAADIEFKRVEMLSKAGLNDVDSMTQLIIDNEQKIAKIIALLRELSSECSHCRAKIINEVSKFTQEANPIVVEPDGT